MLSYTACFLPIQLWAHGLVFMRRHVSRKEENVLSHMVGVTILKTLSRSVKQVQLQFTVMAKVQHHTVT